MKLLIHKIKSFFKYYNSPRCEHCGKPLIKYDGEYSWGIEVYHNIGKTESHIANICNLCYTLFTQNK